MTYEEFPASVTRTPHSVFFRFNEAPEVFDIKKGKKKADTPSVTLSKDAKAWLSENAKGYHLSFEWGATHNPSASNPHISFCFVKADEAKGFIKRWGK